MSHRRESGAVPPWVIPEHHTPTISKVKNGSMHKSECKNEMDHVELSPNRHSLSPINIRNDISPTISCTSSGDTPVKFRTRAVGKRLTTDINVPTLDATGLLVMPGGVDMASYVSETMQSTNAEAFTNATKEALLGGTTMIVDTLICPKGSNPLDVVAKCFNLIKDSKLWCDVSIRVGFLEVDETMPTQITRLVNDFGINSFLFLVGTPESGSVTLANLHSALNQISKLGAIAIVRPHSVLSDTNPNIIESEIKTTEMAIMLGGSTNCPLVLASPHTAESIEKIAKARRNIPPAHMMVSCAPSSLLPAMKNGEPSESKFLAFLTTGDIFAISSDQYGSNHPSTTSRLGAIGQRLVAVWEAGVPAGWLDASSFVNLTSANASKLTGLYPNKGYLGPGSDADLVLWPTESIADSGTGRPKLVLFKGKVMARGGALLSDDDKLINIAGDLQSVKVPEPCGKLIKLEPFPPSIYGPVRATERFRKRYQVPVVREPWNMTSLAAEITEQTCPESNESNLNVAVPVTEEKTDKEIPTSPTSGVRMVHGHRDLHASGFSLSGAQVDDDRPIRSGIRTRQPPGGASKNPLW